MKKNLSPLSFVAAVVILFTVSCSSGTEDPLPQTRSNPDNGAEPSYIGGLVTPFVAGEAYTFSFMCNDPVIYPRETEWIFSDNLRATVTENKDHLRPFPWWSNRQVSVVFEIESDVETGTLLCRVLSESFAESPYSETVEITVKRPDPIIEIPQTYRPVIIPPGGTIAAGSSAEFQAYMPAYPNGIENGLYKWEVIRQGEVVEYVLWGMRSPVTVVPLYFPYPGEATVVCTPGYSYTDGEYFRTFFYEEDAARIEVTVL